MSPRVPDDFPQDVTPASLSGAQPKLAARLIDGKFIVGQTDDERYQRYAVCEDLAQQLVGKAQKDAARYPHLSREVTLKRIRRAIEVKGWVSVVEAEWLVERLRALLHW
jgi:inorganic pyrophosphatase